MGTTLYSFEELTTIACQVEACLNSRPLLPITSHNQDGLMTLTASHFLLYDSPSSYPEDPRLPATPDLLKKWTHCQAIIQHFWQRWSREYLSTLQARSKWQHQSPNLQVGDIVVLKHEKTFSCHWPLARVTAVFPGQDGLVRVAEVKTATGQYKRPVVKLSLLHRPATPQKPLQPLPPGGCSDKQAPSATPSQPPSLCSSHSTAARLSLEPELINTQESHVELPTSPSLIPLTLRTLPYLVIFMHV